MKAKKNEVFVSEGWLFGSNQLAESCDVLRTVM